ncbi:E3 SUMO-protein ligase ZBED1-like [Nothobranchius furzeri]|uniref:E3 SUMO-protein ligase ZBED1-like n=1 Tax=Nothobranchius furzeri TaxID=105023 RepID=UPI003904BB45
MKVKYFGNTSNARAHLLHHRPELKEAEQPLPPQTPGQRTLHHFAKLPANSERAKWISKAIACFISKDLRPYSFVENEGFRFVLRTTEPKYVIPSHQFFTEKAIPQLHEETKAKLPEALAKAHRVALTCDAWTSRATHSFVTFTAHYITDTWQIESRVTNTTDEWNRQIRDVVTGNAANMLAAVQLDNLTHSKCFAHTLNLAAHRALKLNHVSRLLGRIRRTTGFFHRSPIASHALQEKQNLLQLPAHKLKTDVTTRWNSAYEMVKRYLEQQPAICAALLSPHVRKSGSSGDTCTLSETDISNAEERAKALKPLKDATNIMSEDSCPTLPVTAPLHAQLLQDTEAASAADEAPLVQEIKRTLHEDLSKRYTSFQSKNILLTASTLDPRFKALLFLSREEQLDVHARVTAEAAALEKEVVSAEVGAENPVTKEEEESPPPKRALALVNLLGRTFMEVRAVPKSAGSRAEEELRKYLEVPPLSLSEDPLQ